jgi:alpha-D-ribose 1-methylphosphonate 5-triphosphate diphosphatase
VTEAFSIVGGRVLTPHGLQTGATLQIEHGRISSLESGARHPKWDARGLLVLPGIVDLHGDAFERQLMPRPGVHFDAHLALIDTDRQLIANGITTAFHGLTYSWEPGLRGLEAGQAFVAALEAMRPSLACDARLHLRWETYNLDVAEEVASWLTSGVVALLAFNDHTPEMIRKASKPDALLKYAERSGLGFDEFRALLDRVHTRQPAVPAAIERLARVARAAGVPMASHDDDSPDQRRWFRSLGCAISEFPKNEATARVARDDGHDIVMGAPNVVRGGSHLSAVSASAMIAGGLCTILSSDYYYPAQLQAAFRLARDGICPLETAWKLIAENPARAGGLDDRGVIADGKRADLIIVDDRQALPRVVATIVAGKPVFFDARFAVSVDLNVSDKELAHAG